MKKTSNRKRRVSAESIAKRADRGQDVTRYFTNTGRMMPPVQRVNVDFAQDMLQESDDQRTRDVIASGTSGGLQSFSFPS